MKRSTISPIIAAIFAAIMTAIMTASAADNDGPWTLTDGRDGKTYKTAALGGKRWMAENLNHKKGRSWCHNNDNSNCDKYGRLYDWRTAKTVCPAGWHLPSRQEWDDLGQAVGGERKPESKGNISWDGAGKKLKTRSGWSKDGNGTDEYGFSALPGGFRHHTGGTFANGGGSWWTVTDGGDGNAYFRGIFDDDFIGTSDDLYENDFEKLSAFSVRCVQD